MRASLWRDLLQGAFVVVVLGASANASAMPLREAVERAMTTNPQIGEAIANREATEFELDQGRGGYLPSIDLEARAGALMRDSATTRAIGRDDDVFAERSVGIVMRQQSAPYARAQARVPPAPPPEALDREPPFSSPLGPLYLGALRQPVTSRGF